MWFRGLRILRCGFRVHRLRLGLRVLGCAFRVSEPPSSLGCSIFVSRFETKVWDLGAAVVDSCFRAEDVALVPGFKPT